MRVPTGRMSTTPSTTTSEVILGQISSAVSPSSRRSRREAIMVVGLGTAILAVFVLSLLRLLVP